MRERCLRNIFLVLFLAAFLVGGLLSFLNRLSHSYTSQEVSPVRLEEVKILMRYHGARIVKYENGNWYFLGPRNKWLPLKTGGACRYLASLSSKPKHAVCLF